MKRPPRLPAQLPAEQEIAQLWWTLPPGCQLPLTNGATYQLLFPGYPGSSAGPDVRDAILISQAIPSCGMSAIVRIVGDVEFHIHASDWFTHKHHNDPRYNRVILHVVLICDDRRPAHRHDGQLIPLCSLYDIPSVTTLLPFKGRISRPTWLCQQDQYSSQEGHRALLTQSGLLRFEQKAHAFIEYIRATPAIPPYDCFDSCLIPALAEGLAYGRDRDFFRSAGLRLLHQHAQSHYHQLAPLPEPLGHSSHPSSLDASRLRVLARMVLQWQHQGGWKTLHTVLTTHRPDPYQSLQAFFVDLGLSQARTRILLCNIVLPFAYAVALLEQNTELATQAQTLYRDAPTLPSNRITRLMCTQLGIAQEPANACQQQGLHYIYQQNCREKFCNTCTFGKGVRP